MSKTSQNISKVIVLPDIHSIEVDRVTLAAVEKYMEEGRFDRGIQLGDLLNFDCISRHTEKNLRAINANPIQEEYDFCNRMLDRWYRSIGHWDLIEGNHEYRVENWLNAHPQARGLLEVSAGLKLKERGMGWIPYWSKGSTAKIGKAVFGHGVYTNEHHAKKHVQYYGTNFFYGHTHDVQQYSQVLHGDDLTIVGQSLGCLCRYDLDYIQGKPTKWQQAFGVFYFFPNGFFNYYVVRIFNHRFVSPEGIVYDGRKIARL